MNGRCAALGVVLASLLAREAGAETPELRIQVGDRIRYRIGTEKTVKAMVLETDPEWLRIEDERGASHRLDKSALQSLAVVRGKRRNALGGALIGFLPGAAFGAFAAGAMCDRDSPCNVAPVALVLGGMSAVLGAGVGALIKTDHWEEAPVSRVRFGIAPARGGVRAAVTL
jgi:hypothetical protein